MFQNVAGNLEILIIMLLYLERKRHTVHAAPEETCGILYYSIKDVQSEFWQCCPFAEVEEGVIGWMAVIVIETCQISPNLECDKWNLQSGAEEERLFCTALSHGLKISSLSCAVPSEWESTGNEVSQISDTTCSVSTVRNGMEIKCPTSCLFLGMFQY